MSGGLADQIIQAESGGSATAKNPRSSATGAGQFIDGTWIDMVGRYRPDLAGLPRDQVLALRNDPALSKEMVQHYADENGAKLSAAGLPDNDGTRYLSHFAGPGGARAILSADPSTPAAQVLQPGQVAANPFVRPMTAGQLVDWASRKVGGSSAPMTMPGASAAAGAFSLAGPRPAGTPSSTTPLAGATATLPEPEKDSGPDIAALLKRLAGGTEGPASAIAQTAAAPKTAPASARLQPPQSTPRPFDASRFFAMLPSAPKR